MSHSRLPEINEKSLAIILDIVSDGIWDWNANTGDVYRSPAWYTMLGYAVDSLEGTVFSWENIIHQDDYDRVMGHFENYITHQSDHYKIQYRCRTQLGDYIWVEDRAHAVDWNADGTVARMIGAQRNINAEMALYEHSRIKNTTLEERVEEQTSSLLDINKQLETTNAEFKRLATTDFLTSLANRYHFEEKLNNESARAKRFNEPLSLIAFDLDKFKPVNDRYGHKTGDIVLKKIADILTSNLREIDIPARWGGDEFMVLLPNTSIEQAMKLAEKLRQLVEKEMSEMDLDVTGSFGIVQLEYSEEPMRLTIRVDDALYYSKNHGRNKITVA